MASLDEPVGWHSRGYLPHFDVPGLVQAVTFRLADTLPAALVQEFRRTGAASAAYDDELDRNRGRCWLGRADIAALVQRALLTFDGRRYRMLAWCVMPNHLHALVEPLPGWRLGGIVRSWKSFTARRANAVLGRTGPFWSADYFDRYIRSDEHFAAALAYIEGNPVKAGLARAPEDWPWSSAAHRNGKAR